MVNILNKTISRIKPIDKEAMANAQTRQDNLTKPQGSMGILEDISIRLAGIQGRTIPKIERKAIITMAGDHGVVAENIGNWPQEVTAQMVLNFLRGGAGINVISRQIGARVIVVDMGVATRFEVDPRLVSIKIAPGTRNMANGPAMTQEQAIRAVEAGIEIIDAEVEKGLDIVGTGDMGIGNTTPSAAICAIMTGRKVSEVTGRGTGLSDPQLKHKIAVIEKAISVNKPDAEKPLEVLSKVGGFEIAGLAGVMIGAAASRVAVVVDGFISGAAALIATAIAPGCKDYLFAGHLSTEPGHRFMLEHLGLKPLVNLEMRLGEGTGAALGISIVEAAARILSEMATFSEAGVSEKEE